MKKILGMGALITFFICQLAFSDSEKIDLLLKARGLQANENLGKLTNTKKLSTEQICNMDIENSYLAFAIPDMAKIVRKPAGEKLTAYNFAILNHHGKNKLVDIQFQYKYGDGADIPVAFTIPDVRNNATAVFMPSKPNQAMLITDDCLFLVDMTNPLNITVVPRGERKRSKPL